MVISDIRQDIEYLKQVIEIFKKIIIVKWLF